MVFIVDSSSGVDNNSYARIKMYLKSISQSLRVSEDQIRAAVLIYGTSALLAIRFNSYKTLPQLNRLIEDLPKIGGRRRSDLGLEVGARALSQARRDVPKVAVLITTGPEAQTIHSKSVATAAQSLWKIGANLFILAIGGKNDRRELNSIARKPDDIVYISSPTQLPSYVNLVAKKVTGSGIFGKCSPGKKFF